MACVRADVARPDEKTHRVFEFKAYARTIHIHSRCTLACLLKPGLCACVHVCSGPVLAHARALWHLRGKCR